MEIIVQKYKKVTDFCYELFKISKIQLYNSKFSNKMYSNFQKLTLLVYKQFRKFTYEELMTDLMNDSNLREYIGLNKLMDYTTLIKFSKTLPNSILENLVDAFKQLIPSPKKIAIDATGISLDNASAHYCKRTGLTFKKRPFMKTSFVVDIETYIILLCRMRKRPRHDTIDAKILLKKIAKNYTPTVLYADRGYDDNEIFKITFEELKAYPLILQKNIDVPKHRKSGIYRKMTCDIFDYGEYLQRNKIETLNSMFKKRFGSTVLSKTVKTQKVDILTRVIAFNIDRIIKISQQVILIFIRITRVSY